MNQYSVIQAFTIAVAAVLVIVFTIILFANSLTQYQQYQLFITPMLLIIIAIIALGVFSILAKMYYSIEKASTTQKGKK